MDMRFFVGVLVGGTCVSFLMPVQLDAAIPPTPAWKTITVMTSDWFGSDTEVTANNAVDNMFLVSDGSITFNVTENYP